MRVACDSSASECGQWVHGVLGLCLNMWVCDVRHTASGNITTDRLISQKKKVDKQRYKLVKVS